jgi:glycosyltransferase involved in cell wall biosynthesis
MISGGLPAKMVRVVPNFLEPDPGTGSEPRSGFLYVGRLTEEKGVETLLRAAALAPGMLRVAGDGPLRPAVERAAVAGDVEYLGPIEAGSVFGQMRRAIALVLPSIWFEGFPLTVLEAYATGTPVIASRIGSLAEVVVDGVTGLLTEPHDADGLAAQLRWAATHPEAMQERGCDARRQYEARFRGPAHLAALLDTYAAAASRNEPVNGTVAGRAV